MQCRKCLAGVLLASLFVAVFGCAHLRLTASPLEPVVFEVSSSPANTYESVTALLLRKGFDLVREDPGAGILVTGEIPFNAATGSGGGGRGRDYVYTLKLGLRQTETGTEVVLEPLDLATRLLRVEAQGGRLTRISRRYTYEEYPGMFDLACLNRELCRVKDLLESNLVAVRKEQNRGDRDSTESFFSIKWQD